jgi:hypothetical protein
VYSGIPGAGGEPPAPTSSSSVSLGRSGPPARFQPAGAPTPGREGVLRLAAFSGLYHSTDAGKTFARLDGVTELHAFGFGKAAPAAYYSAPYMIGIVDGQRGIFRSDNTARSWVRINDEEVRRPSTSSVD